MATCNMYTLADFMVVLLVTNLAQPTGFNNKDMHWHTRIRSCMHAIRMTCVCYEYNVYLLFMRIKTSAMCVRECFPHVCSPHLNESPFLPNVIIVTPVAGPIFETKNRLKNRAILSGGLFSQCLFGRGISGEALLFYNFNWLWSCGVDSNLPELEHL